MGSSLLIACGPSVDMATLPVVPDVNIEEFEPAVREQVRAAREQLAQRPDSASVNGELGMMYRTYRRFDAARALFVRARALAPREEKWIYYHGELLENIGDTPGALKAVEAFLERNADDVPATLRRARLQTELGDAADALASLEKLRAKYPELGDVHVTYAKALTRLERYTDAAEVWEEALERFGSFRVAHYALGQLLRRLGDSRGAEQQLWLFDVATVAEPPHYDPLMQALFALNKSDRVLVRSAQAAKRKGDAQGALALLEKAIARNPQNMETRAGLVSGYTVESDFANATRHARSGLEIEPEHAALNLAFGRLLLQQGKLVEATSRFKRVVQRSPKLAEAHAWLGRAREISGDATAAGEAYRQAIALDSSQRTARRFYAAWLSANATPAQARAGLSALTQTPSRDVPQLLSALATLQVRGGDREGALVSLDRAIELARLMAQSKTVSKLANQRARLERDAA
ncbi:MAG: tetratricopeptide repeat protein [Gammaproteobacteria bacterium]